MEKTLDAEGTGQEIHQGWKITLSYVLTESLKNYLDEMEIDAPKGELSPAKQAAEYFFSNLLQESHNDYHTMLEALGKTGSRQSEYIECRLLGPKSPYLGIFERDFLKDLNMNIRSEAKRELDSAARQAKRDALVK